MSSNLFSWVDLSSVIFKIVFIVGIYDGCTHSEPDTDMEHAHTILVEGCESRHGMVAGGMVYVMLQYSAPLVTAARHASGPLAAL